MIRRAIITLCLVASGALASDVALWESSIGQTDQVTSGLVAYWAMRAGGGRAVIDEVASLNLTNVTQNANPAFYQYGAVGDGVAVSPTNYLKQSVANFSNTQVGTVCYWANIAETGVVFRVFYSSDEASPSFYFLLQHLPQGASTLVSQFAIFSPSNTALQATFSGSYLNQWNFYAWTSDGSTMRFYRNGVESALTATAGSNQGTWLGDIANRDNVSVGAWFRSTLSTSTTSGFVDEIRVYNRVLTDDEIKQLYRMGAEPRSIK